MLALGSRVMDRVFDRDPGQAVVVRHQTVNLEIHTQPPVADNLVSWARKNREQRLVKRTAQRVLDKFAGQLQICK